MEIFFRASYSLVSKRPGFIIALILGVFILCFGAFSNIEVADEIEGGISDPAALAGKRKFELNFSPEQSISLAFETGEISRESLTEIWDIVREIRKIPEVRRVMSVLDIFRPMKTRESFIDYLREFRIENARAVLAEDEMFRGFLISRDLKKVCLVIIPNTDFPDYQKKLYASLRELLPRIFSGREYHLFGFMYFKERFFEFIAMNNVTFLSLSLLVCTTLAFFFFPDPVILLLIVVSIIIPVVMTFAVYFYFGNKINIFTSPIIPFALIISLNELIFLVSFFIQEKGSRGENYELLHESNFRKLLKPCLINTLTTLIGFSSLSQNPSENIRLFSIYTSLACFLSYFISFGLVFSFLKLYQPSFSFRGRRSIRFHGLGKFVRNLTISHPGKILIGGFLLFVISLAYVNHFDIRNGIGENFQPGDPLLISFEYFRKNFSGPYFIQIMLSNEEILSGKYLRQIDRFQEKLKVLPEINRVFSVVDLVRKFTGYLSSGPEIPESRLLIKSIVKFFAARGISEFLVSPDWNVTLVRASIGISDFFQIGSLRERILAIARDCFSPKVRVELTGEVFLNAVLQKNILENISWSFACAIMMIVLVFFAVFRDPVFAFIALAVNFFPIHLGYVVAGLCGIPLNSSTMVVGCVMSGLIVDDTLHLLTVYKEAGKPSKVRGIIFLLREMTAPVMYSALLLGLGNAIFIFSPFYPFRYFGAIGTLIVGFGIIGDIILLPAMIMVLTKKEVNVQKEGAR